jgi:hypothetical protein
MSSIFTASLWFIASPQTGTAPGVVSGGHSVAAAGRAHTGQQGRRVICAGLQQLCPGVFWSQA